MNKASIEITAGAFVIAGLLCIGYLSIKLGKLELSGDNFLVINAKFDSVSGLQNGSSVDIAGVKIGRVESINFDNINQVAIVTMKIRKGVPISEDVIASIRTSGIIGNKYVKLIPGCSDELLKPGDYIQETESSVDIEELISKYLFGNT